MSDLTQDAADRALDPLREVLEADGYRLATSIAEAGGAPKLVLQIEATPEACADCLVPRGVAESIARTYLAEAVSDADRIALEIRYPTDPIAT
jgi:hypothetical protein